MGSAGSEMGPERSALDGFCTAGGVSSLCSILRRFWGRGSKAEGLREERNGDLLFAACGFALSLTGSARSNIVTNVLLEPAGCNWTLHIPEMGSACNLVSVGYFTSLH